MHLISRWVYCERFVAALYLVIVMWKLLIEKINLLVFKDKLPFQDKKKKKNSVNCKNQNDKVSLI